MLPAVFLHRFDWYLVYFAYCHALAHPVQSLKSHDAVHRIIVRDFAGAMSQQRAADVLFALVLAIESLPDDEGQSVSEVAEALGYVKSVLDQVSQLSPAVGLRLVMLDGQHAIVPHGAGILDEELVDANLVWLEAYPKAAMAFMNALRTYSEGDKRRYRDVLDNLRFALEQTLKGVLRNSKPLEKQADALLLWLKTKGVHTQTRNLVRQVLAAYSHFQNEAVKHDIAYSEKEVEFYIYQTGTLLRLLLTLAESSQESRGASVESP